jgi:tetratricopeptide (TPR) repeat protein
MILRISEMVFPPFPFIRDLIRSAPKGAIAVALLIAVFTVGATAQETESDPVDQAVALFNLGQEAHEKGDTTDAIASYKKAIELIPEFPEAEFQLAVAYKQTGKPDLAEKSFRRAVELRGDWTLALAGLGSYLVDVGRFEEAEPHLLKAVELDSQNFPALSALTELRLRTNATPDELRSLLKTVSTAAVGVRPPVSIIAARGALENAVGDKAAAKATFARVLELDPTNRTALGEMAIAAIDDRDLARADGLIKRLESASAGPSYTGTIRARYLVAEGKPGEAEKLLAELPEQTLEVKELRKRIALVASTDTAALEKQAEAEPSNVSARARLCALFRASEPMKALHYCKAASQLEPDNIEHAVGYAAALVQAEEYASAIVVLKTLTATAPNNSTIRANLATAFFRSNRLAEAKTEYRWLADKQPDLAVTYYFLGIVHDRLGEYLDAAANYQQFIKIADPKVHGLELERINLRMLALQRQIKDKKGK